MVKVGGVFYQVRRGKMMNEGESLFREGIINICHEACDDIASLALVHEILEIINNEHGLNLSHSKIQSLGSAIHQVLKDNPGLVE